MKQHLRVILFLLFIPSLIFAQSPEIVSPPVSKSACAGTSVELGLEATGAGLSYEWFHDGTSIGNNNNILSYASVATADAGEYYCVVTNTEGSVTSATVQIVVVDGVPTVTSSPVSENLCEGSDQTFTVEYSGLSNFAWFHDGEQISLEYSNSLSLTNFDNGDVGTYYCQLTNICGSVNSDEFTLSVTENVEITNQSSGATVCEGEAVEMSVEATGTDIEYQWKYEGADIDGATDATYQIDEMPVDMTGMFSCVVGNDCSSETSLSVAYSINALPNITGTPISTSDCVGETITLTSTANGTGDITSQWMINGELQDGETSSAIDITLVAGDTLYVCNKFTNACGSVYSDSAMVIPDEAPTITDQPETQTVCQGDTAHLSVKVVGKEPITYQWKKGGVNVYGMQYSGDESSILNINGVNESHIGDYTCEVTNSCGEVISIVATLSVQLPPVVWDQPNAVAECEGDTAKFDLWAEGTDPLAYSWHKLDGDADLSTADSLWINGLTPEDAGQYYCIIDNVCGDYSSDTVELEVKLAPYFIVQPEDTEVCEGDSVSLTVSVGGYGDIGLMWYRGEDNGAMTSELDSILTYNPSHHLQSDTYFCSAMGECGVAESDVAYLSIGTLPVITLNPAASMQECENNELQLFADAAGEGLNYQWYHEGDAIPGQTDTTLHFMHVDDALSGEVYFQAYNACAAVNSEVSVLTINPAPEFNLGEDVDFCLGGSVTLSTDVPAQSYNWNNGLSNYSSITVDTTGVFVLAAIGDNGCTGYDTVEVHVHDYYEFDLGEDVEACGEYVIDAGEGAHSYLWNNAAENHAIVVNVSGQYYVTAQGDDYGCETSDTINVTILEKPTVNLGADHTIAHDSTLLIVVSGDYSSFLWSNGDVDNSALFDAAYMQPGDHDIWCEVSLENGCTARDSVIITVMNGNSIDMVESSERIDIYPNPSYGEFTLDFDMKENLENVSIYDYQGKLMQYVDVNLMNSSINFSTESLKSGMYIVNLKTKTRNLNYRLIKK